jgi:phage antirepressor YoqD-like protein
MKGECGFMSNLVLYKSERFNNVECDLWKNENNEIYMTREQIGRALEYNSPANAIRKIHERYKERIDKFSWVAQVDLPFGGKQEVYLYNIKGLYEICRWSKQNKANEFMDWVWGLLESIRTNEVQLLQSRLKQAQPKLELYEQVISARNSMTMLQVAKILKIKGRNKLFSFLRNEDILMTKHERHNIPRQQFCDAGYFEVVIKPMLINGEVVDIPVTLVTPKGVDYILKRLKKKDLLLQA